MFPYHDVGAVPRAPKNAPACSTAIALEETTVELAFVDRAVRIDQTKTSLVSRSKAGRRHFQLRVLLLFRGIAGPGVPDRVEHSIRGRDICLHATMLTQKDKADR
jgi:hypothetical protein